MRIPEPGPLGETFFEARARAISGALFVNRPSCGCVESEVTVRTQRFPARFARLVDFAREPWVPDCFAVGFRFPADFAADRRVFVPELLRVAMDPSRRSTPMRPLSAA